MHHLNAAGGLHQRNSLFVQDNGRTTTINAGRSGIFGNANTREYYHEKHPSYLDCPGCLRWRHTSISHSLTGKLGYNSEDDGIGEDGFFWEGNLKTTASAELNNGLKAGAYFETTIDADNAAANDDQGADIVSSDFVLSLEGGNAGLFFGDTGTAANKHWKSAGNMEQDGFTSGTASAVLRGDASFGGVDASVSYIIDDANDTAEQLSFGAAGTFGAITVGTATSPRARSSVYLRLVLSLVQL